MALAAAVIGGTLLRPQPMQALDTEPEPEPELCAA